MVDLSIFERQKSVLDQQQLQEAFNLKKALAVQGAQRDALEMQALQAQAANGGLTLKDMMTMQMQQQNNQENRDIRREGMDIQRANAAANIDLRRDTIDAKQAAKDDKIDLKFRNDQNLLAGATATLDEQIARVDKIFGKRDDNGNLLLNEQGLPILPPMKGIENNYGFAQISNKFSGTDASSAAANLDQLDAAAFIGKLGEMKSQSATGASGLGSATEREGDKVQSAASAAANRKQDFNSAVKNAIQYRKEMEATKARLQGGFQNIYKDRIPASPTIDPEAAKAELARRAAAKGVQ